MKSKILLLFLLLNALIALSHVGRAEEDEEDMDLIDAFLKDHSTSPASVTPEPEFSKKQQEESHRKKSTTTSNHLPSTKINPNPNNNNNPHHELPIPSVPFHTDEDFHSQENVSETEPCSCVKYFLCDIENGQVIDNGAVYGLIDIRLGSKSPCSHYFDICCKTKKNETAMEKIPVPSMEHKTCGKRNTGGVGFRITGAQDGEAQFGEFPWMAAIVRQEQQDDKPPLNIFVCGGSLIHPRVILTAAHCVFGKPLSELKVRLGEWDTQTLDELYQHQDRFVTKVIVHEDYYMGALYNDVALVFLDEDITFAPNIDTICLPPPNMNFDGQRCVASGWGKDSFEKEGKYQVILKRLDLPIVPRPECESSLRKTRLGPYFKLDSSFVCAGGEPGRDTCRGDGGSPLVCKLPNSEYYVQYGIVAWGIGCGEVGLPGVYVNVPKFVPWIEENLIKSGFDTKYYKS